MHVYNFEHIYKNISNTDAKAKHKGKAATPVPKQNIKASFLTLQEHESFRIVVIYISFPFSYVTDSCAQNASGSGKNREWSWISKFAMCQSTKSACINLNSRRMDGKSHHLSSSLRAHTVQKHITCTKDAMSHVQNNFIISFKRGLISF